MLEMMIFHFRTMPTLDESDWIMWMQRWYNHTSRTPDFLYKV